MKNLSNWFSQMWNTTFQKPVDPLQEAHNQWLEKAAEELRTDGKISRKTELMLMGFEKQLLQRFEE